LIAVAAQAEITRHHSLGEAGDSAIDAHDQRHAGPGQFPQLLGVQPDKGWNERALREAIEEATADQEENVGLPLQ
jgi:hypothetical protein